MPRRYVHGHHKRARQRLQDQAGALVDLLHDDTTFPRGAVVLEAGCGVGAQTVTLARRSPGARFLSVDRSATALAAARRAVRAAGLSNVTFKRGDLRELPFPARSFDHLFVCFVLEHLPEAAHMLARLCAFVRPGGTVTVIEGDHGSAYFHPDSSDAQHAIGCQVALQARNGGNALIGRQVYPLMVAAGLDGVSVRPLMVYADASRPGLVEAFTEKTFIAMVADVRGDALAARLTTARRFDRGIRDLRRTTASDGVFCYTFFKGRGTVRKGPTPALGALRRRLAVYD